MIDVNDYGGLPNPQTEARFYDGVLTRRLVAFLIDVAISTVLGVGATLVFGVATLGVGFLLALPVMAAVDFLYRWATISRWSATPGMAALGVELRRYDGERFGQVEALIHTGLFYVLMASAILQLVSVAMMLSAPVKRGLHDLIMGSTMINRPA